MKLRLDPWSADYGPSLAMPDSPDEDAATDLGAEVPVDDWRPVSAENGDLPDTLAVVDGVRRVEAHMRLEGGDSSHPVCLGTLGAGGLRITFGQPSTIAYALQMGVCKTE